MHDRVKVRESEMKLLIDEVCSKEYLKTLGFSDRACLDTSKLVMAGHSMGGATALRVGHSDPRVSCVLTHDPWLFPVHKEIEEGSLNGFKDKFMFVLNSYSFLGFMKGFDGPKIHNTLISSLESSKIEDIVINHCHHFHQNDTVGLNPFETEQSQLLRLSIPRTN